MKLGPAWWFHDSPEGMRRFRNQETETAGFYNNLGFNDDTRAFMPIPARHDVAQRIDCGFLAQLVAEHRLEEWEAVEVASTVRLRSSYKAFGITLLGSTSFRRSLVFFHHCLKSGFPLRTKKA